MNNNYRKLSTQEVLALKSQRCFSKEWDKILVDPDFKYNKIWDVEFSGDIRLGVFDGCFELPGGVKKQAGLCKVKLHNVSIGDNTCIENIHNYIANYDIGKGCIIENVDKIVTEGESSFGNGVEASVLNETGGREVPINNKLSAHFAYIIALYRHRPKLIAKMRELVDSYSTKYRSSRGKIGNKVRISETGSLKNVIIGDFTTIEGALLLQNGTINSNESDPVYIGYGTRCEDFIICSGAHIDNGAIISRCFIGQSTTLSRNYSASDSLFFSNCHGENGEACAIFAGPYTVSHHKSTLLIAGMFSFMNAGSGSNQSNHMYKLGPIHQGILERGAKTASDSYILWPAKVGAFSLVMGRHVTNSDTSSLPFSYLIEKNNTTYLMPGVNLRSVGTIRDAQKWPKRDGRRDPVKLDHINYNLLSPYTIQKMMCGLDLLKDLKRVSGETTDIYSYKSTKIKNSSLVNGIRFYEIAIHKFLGNSIIKRLEGTKFQSIDEIRERLLPDTKIGSGEWLDIAGLIAPRSEIERLMDSIESGEINKIGDINSYFEHLHLNYYNYEWTWAYEKIEEFYNINLASISVNEIVDIVNRWRDSVVSLDKMVYNDAQKEFSLGAMTGFGADGDHNQRREDFEQVRGVFEENQFVKAVLKHIKDKSELGEELISRIGDVK